MVSARIEKRRRIRRQESGEDGGAGKRSRGRPKRRWMDTIGNDLSEKELSREDTQDRAKWRSLIRHIDPT